MAYFVLYNRTTNNLIDISDIEFPPERVEPQLVQESREGDIPDVREWYWNTATLSFFNKHIRKFPKLEFLNLFTPQERVTARASADPFVKDFLALLDIAEFVSTEDPNTIQALQYLAYLGIITSDRATQIIGS